MELNGETDNDLPKIDTETIPEIHHKKREEELYLLEFEQKLVNEMHIHPNCLAVVARGFSIPRVVAAFLFQKYSLWSAVPAKPQCPYLIFMVNFEEVEFNGTLFAL